MQRKVQLQPPKSLTKEIARSDGLPTDKPMASKTATPSLTALARYNAQDRFSRCSGRRKAQQTGQEARNDAAMIDSEASAQANFIALGMALSDAKREFRPRRSQQRGIER